MFFIPWPWAVWFMAHGFWATRAWPGLFAATAAAPRHAHLVMFHFRGMAWAVRHGWECTRHAPRMWFCTRDQIL